MNIQLTITGMEAYTSRGAALVAAMQQFSGARAVVGTNVVYAPFIEFGTRFMHGRPFLENALESERGAITSRLEGAIRAVEGGANPGELTQALHAAGLAVQAEAQRNVPVKTGNLRRSLHTEVFGR